jgi:predicted RNase H-like HicB family nuclease
MPSELTIEYTLYIWQESHQFIAHALPLDVMSSGPTPEAARKALDEAVKVFLPTLDDMETTAEVLRECGYELIQGSWKSPPWVSIERHSAVVGI